MKLHKDVKHLGNPQKITIKSNTLKRYGCDQCEYAVCNNTQKSFKKAQGRLYDECEFKSSEPGTLKLYEQAKHK